MKQKTVFSEQEKIVFTSFFKTIGKYKEIKKIIKNKIKHYLCDPILKLKIFKYGIPLNYMCFFFQFFLTFLKNFIKQINFKSN